MPCKREQLALVPAALRRNEGYSLGGSLGRVLINRPAMSAFGQTGHRANIAE